MTGLEGKSLTLDLLVLHNIILKQIVQSFDLCMTEHDDKKNSRLDLSCEMDFD